MLQRENKLFQREENPGSQKSRRLGFCIEGAPWALGGPPLECLPSVRGVWPPVLACLLPEPSRNRQDIWADENLRSAAPKMYITWGAGEAKFHTEGAIHCASGPGRRTRNASGSTAVKRTTVIFSLGTFQDGVKLLLELIILRLCVSTACKE